MQFHINRRLILYAAKIKVVGTAGDPLHRVAGPNQEWNGDVMHQLNQVVGIDSLHGCIGRKRLPRFPKVR